MTFLENNRKANPMMASLTDRFTEGAQYGAPMGMMKMGPGSWIPNEDPIATMLAKRTQLRNIREAIAKSWKASQKFDNIAEKVFSTGDVANPKYLAKAQFYKKQMMGEDQLKDITDLVKQLERETEPLRLRMQVMKRKAEVEEMLKNIFSNMPVSNLRR